MTTLQSQATQTILESETNKVPVVTAKATPVAVVIEDDVILPADELNIILGMRDKALPELADMLRYMRPMGSAAEKEFREKYLHGLPDMKQDECGNLILLVGKEDDVNVMWSCHTDTVHSVGGMQDIIYQDDDWLALPNQSKSSCLGADDTAGLWLMKQMVEAGIPGLYIFHWGEEKGRVGSRFLAKNHPKLFEGIDIAIAFDRRGYEDVITHQLSGRCCSDDFAKSLAEQMNMGYKPSDKGVYTDTASYIDLIGECTNLSVGYFGEHTPRESLNLSHLLDMRDALLQIDTSKLVVKRQPGEVDPNDKWANWQGGYGGYHGGAWDMWDEPEDIRKEPGWHKPQSMLELVRDFSYSVSRVLEDMGLTVDDIWEDVVKGFNHNKTN